MESIVASDARRRGRRPTVVHLRLLIGCILAISSAALLFGVGAGERFLELGGYRARLSTAAGIAEALAAYLLIFPGSARSRGIALLAWLAGTVIVRTSGVYEGQCDCLRIFGGHPAFIYAVWAGIFVVGTIEAFRSPWPSRFRLVTDLMLAAASIAGAVVLADAVPRTVDDVEVEVAIERVGPRLEKGTVRLTNRRDSPVRGLELTSSCHCLYLEGHVDSIAPGATVAVEFRIDDRPAGVEPVIEIRGAVGSTSITTTASVP